MKIITHISRSLIPKLAITIIITLLVTSSALGWGPFASSVSKSSPFTQSSSFSGNGVALGFAHVTADNLSFVTSLDHTYGALWSDDNYFVAGDTYYTNIYDYQVSDGNNISPLGNMFPISQSQAAGNTVCYSINSWDSFVPNQMRNYTAIKTWEVGQEYPFVFGDGKCSLSSPYAFSRYGGNFSESASAYATLLKAAYQTIKAYEPTAQVNCLAADLFGAGWPIKNSTTWSDDVWADGASNYCNAVDLHEYSWPFLMNQTNTQVYPHESESKLVNRTLSQYEQLTGKPIWITETGYQSQGAFTLYNGTKVAFTPQFQAAGLEQEYNFYLHIPYIKGVFWYQVKDGNYSTCTADCHYGLFDDLGDPKPALCTWEVFNGVVPNMCSPQVSMDGYAESRCGSSTSCQMTLTTKNTNDIVFVVEGVGGACPTFAPPTDTGGHTMILRVKERPCTAYGQSLSEWYFTTSSILTSDKITCHVSSQAVNLNCIAVAIAGADISDPFASDLAILASNTGGATEGTTAAITVTTTLHDSNDMLLVFGNLAWNPTIMSNPAGFYALGKSGSYPTLAGDYRPVESVSGRLAISYSLSTAVYWSTIVEAVRSNLDLG